MNLSQDTVGILKNFASINPNIVLKVGNTVKTISEAKNIMAAADISEDIPVEFGIYDLNEFLNVVSLFDEPVVQFEDTKKCRIADARQKQSVNYYFSDPSILTSPQKDIIITEFDVTFTLTGNQMNSLRRAAATLGVSDMVIEGKDGDVVIKVTDLKDPTSNSYELEIATSNASGNFNLVFNINNLKVIPGDYQVDISKKLIAKFNHQEFNVHYWIALEKNSTFN